MRRKPPVCLVRDEFAPVLTHAGQGGGRVKDPAGVVGMTDGHSGRGLCNHDVSDQVPGALPRREGLLEEISNRARPGDRVRVTERDHGTAKEYCESWEVAPVAPPPVGSEQVLASGANVAGRRPGAPHSA